MPWPPWPPWPAATARNSAHPSALAMLTLPPMKYDAITSLRDELAARIYSTRVAVYDTPQSLAVKARTALLAGRVFETELRAANDLTGIELE